jgi:alpha-L-rhamnosidase
MTSGERDQMQTAYQIIVSSSPALLSDSKADLWNSGKETSDRSIQVEYAGKTLKSHDKCWWKVRVWDRDGKASSWSAPAIFEIGILDPGGWEAEWISTEINFDTAVYPSPMFRKEFKLDKEISSARLYVSSLGLYEAEINGKRVGDLQFTPGWTSYEDHIQYQTFDVTQLLTTGSNALGITLGNGWYRFYPNNKRHRGRLLAAIVQLEVRYKDSSKRIIASDDTWKSSTGPILAATIFDGETYDARLEKAGWSTAGYDDGEWAGVKLLEHHPKDLLIAPSSPPMRRIEEIKPVKIILTPEGDTVIDMGQNMVGWLHIRVNAPAGTKISIRHAEVLDKEGNFYAANLRTAAQTNTYICRGGGSDEMWEPSFTFQGFRFAAISGINGPVTPDMFTGIVVHSDLERIGSFICNDSLINQLQHNILWGQKGNFVGVPTDCPQRDERVGWTGDAQVFAATACYNMNCAGFYTKWLKDLSVQQEEDGSVPWIIPHPGNNRRGGTYGWQDAAVIVPWTVYRYYGDKKILREQYNSMKALVEYMRGKAGDSYLWFPVKRQFGDWLAFATTKPDYPGATTDKDLLASAYFYHSTDFLARTAEILGKPDDVVKYRDLMENIKAAYAKEYLTPNGRIASNTQTAYVVSLSFGLVPEEYIPSAAKRLADDVNKFGHLTTGFLGTPDLCHVLTDYGYLDEAYMLLYRKNYPSWLYPVTQGATTIWERWDGQKPDGSFQDPGMNSFNHYAYGAVGDWLYRKVAGIDIDPDKPGYKAVIIKPYPGGEMNDVKAGHESPYGMVSSAWKIRDDKFILTICIPVNSSAEVFVPSTGTALEVNGEIEMKAEKVDAAGLDYHFLRINVGSGHYTFTCDYQQ